MFSIILSVSFLDLKLSTLERFSWFQEAISNRPKGVFVPWRDFEVLERVFSFPCKRKAQHILKLGFCGIRSPSCFRNSLSNLISSWSHITVRGSAAVLPSVVTTSLVMWLANWALEMWLVWIRMCCEHKLQAGLQRLSKKENIQYLSNFNTDYMLKQYLWYSGLNKIGQL